MALATTTLSSAVVVTDTSIVVASATSVAAGRLVLVDGEFMQVTQDYVSGTTVNVVRGQNGTVTTTHAASANVTHGAAADFTVPSPGTSNLKPGLIAFTTTSYYLNIVANGKAAHTVTYTAGLGDAGSGYDVGTFDGSGQCALLLVAANSSWVPASSPMSGTLTAIDVAIA